MTDPPVLRQFGERLTALGWVTDLWVAGSLATGDFVPGVSDLDLVAVVDGLIDGPRRLLLTDLHRRLDAGIRAGQDLGCVYVARDDLPDAATLHPTWTHGYLTDRILSGITRAELVRYGYPVLGRPPHEVLPAVSDDDVRAAARAELAGYWAWAVRRPWMWLDPVIADLGLTAMARGRHALEHGSLLDKSRAVGAADAPQWLVRQLGARRRGLDVRSPRLRTAVVAWRDARRTVARAKRETPGH